MRKVFLLAVAVLLSGVVYAQPGGPGGGSGGDPDADVPLDGGLSVLVAAAVGYGARRKYLASRSDRSGQKPPEQN